MTTRYKNATLNGNWYEDRFETPESPYITLKEKMRPGYGGGPIPLAAGPVDPLMYTTTHSDTHAHALPAARAQLETTKRLLEAKTAAALLSVDNKKDIVAKHSKHFPAFHGYGAVVPRHPPGRDHRILSTTSHTDYGGAYTADISKRTEHFSATATATAAATGAAAPAAAAAPSLSGSASASTLRPRTTPFASRSPLVSTSVNLSIDPTRPLTKPAPHSLSATAHTAVVSSVIGNPLIDPAAVNGGSAAGRHSTQPKKRSGTVSFGATGERLRVGSGFDPKENTFVQRSWWPHTSPTTHAAYAAPKKEKYDGLASIPGAGLAIGTGTGFGVRDTRTSYGRRSGAWKDPTGIWSG